MAAELFGGSREDFLATRTERVREARAAGDRDLARRINGLRKPTVAAWLVNQLVLRYPDDADALADVAAKLGAAHREGTGDELRTAGQDRRELLQRLDIRVRELAGATGVGVGADVAAQIDTTFQAALIDPAALREVLAGRLSGAIAFDPNGIDQWSIPAKPAAAVVSAPPVVSTPPSPPPAPDPAVVAAEERVGTAEAARATAERALTEAQRAAERTEADLAGARAALDAAQERYYAARDAVGEARKTVTGAVQEIRAAESALTETRRQH